MWTHVQVTIQQAKGILAKGKNGTNDVFVIIALGKEKFRTSVKEKAPVSSPVVWNESCELAIPDQGNQAEILLTVAHRNFIGEKFLGLARIPLSQFGADPTPRPRSYILKGKKEDKDKKEKKNDRGHLEVRVSFTNKDGDLSSKVKDKDKEEVNGSRSSIRHGLGHFAASLGGSFSSLRKERKDSVNFDPNGEGSRKEKGKGKVKVSTEPTITFSKVTKKKGTTEYTDGSSSDELPPPPSPVVTKPKESFNGSMDSIAKVKASTPAPRIQVDSFDDDGHTMTMDPETNQTIVVSRSNRGKKLKKGKALYDDDEDDDIDSLHSEPVPKPRRMVAQESFENSKAEKKRIESERKSSLKHSKSKEDLSRLLSLTPSPSSKRKHEDPRFRKRMSISEALFHPSHLFSHSEHHDEEDSDSDKKDKKHHKNPPVGVTMPIPKNKDNKKETQKLSKENLKKFEGQSREDLIRKVLNLQETLASQKQMMDELELYMDNLLVHIMNSDPSILQQRGVMKTKHIDDDQY